MIKIQQVMENKKDEMYSLYDYLGKAAGPDLGAAVWQAAKAAKIKPEEKEVHTKTYSGKILMYPKSFLNSYFGKKTNKVETDDLPF
jgi:hypothetical protein